MQIKCVDERFFHIDAKNIELRIRKQLLVGSQIQFIYPFFLLKRIPFAAMDQITLFECEIFLMLMLTWIDTTCAPF